MGKRIGLVVNPTSGKNRGGALGIEVATRLRAHGHEVLDLSDETAEAARDRAIGAIAQGSTCSRWPAATAWSTWA